MEATGATQLNPAQLNILRLMSYIDTEQEQNELQDILLQFYRQKTDNSKRRTILLNRHWMIGRTSTREHRTTNENSSRYKLSCQCHHARVVQQ